MAILCVLSILFGVLAVLTLGAASGPVKADAMPCHEAGVQTTDMPMTSSPDAPAPSKPVGVTMGCCVMCVVSPLQEPAPPALAVASPSTPVIRAGQGMAGLAPAPASPPPRQPASL
jgi:hypothetical protein